MHWMNGALQSIVSTASAGPQIARSGNLGEENEQADDATQRKKDPKREFREFFPRNPTTTHENHTEIGAKIRSIICFLASSVLL